MQGTVVDARDRPLDAATVTIELHEVPGVRFVTRTNDRGEFIQTGIPPGRYRVTAEKTGSGIQSFDARLHPGHTVEIKFKLVPGRSVAMLPEDENPEVAAKLRAAFDAGAAALKVGDQDRAIASFQQALDISPRCYQCYYNLGLAHAQKKAYPEAEEALRKAVDLKPDYVEAYNRLAGVYTAERKFAEAQAATEEATRLTGGLAAIMKKESAEETIFLEGIVLWNAGRVAEARQKFEEVLRLAPGRPEAHYWVAMAHLSEGHVQEATAGLETYLEMAPTGQYAAEARQALAQLRP